MLGSKLTMSVKGAPGACWWKRIYEQFFVICIKLPSSTIMLEWNVENMWAIISGTNEKLINKTQFGLVPNEIHLARTSQHYIYGEGSTVVFG